MVKSNMEQDILKVLMSEEPSAQYLVVQEKPQDVLSVVLLELL